MLCLKIRFSTQNRVSAKDLTSSVPPALPQALDLTWCLFLLSLHLARSGFFPDLLALYEMTSLTPLDAAAIWRLRTDLKPLL